MKYIREQKLTIKNDNLLSSEQVEYLLEAAIRPFHFGGYDSLEDIVTSLGVEVVIEPGVQERVIPSCLNDIENHWHEELLRCEKLIHDEQSKILYDEIRKKYETVLKEKECWLIMPITGLYDPSTNQIKLFIDEIKRVYVNRSYEVLVATFAHEVMHAYFNRPGHKDFSYVPFIEEPLAEFGMLYFLHITRHPILKWAYNDVKSKITCYHYGATLMDQYIQESYPSRIVQYLKKYKIDLDYYALPTISSDGIISLPYRKSCPVMQEGFKNWMRNYDPNISSERTIKKYADSLPKKDEVKKILQNITRIPDMYSITSVQALSIVIDRIMQEEFDWRGGKTYSCGMKKYIEYLKANNLATNEIYI